MGKNDRKGIYAREASIRLFFNYGGERYFETLSIAPTPANLKYAATLRKEILRRIDLGTFDFREFFPESKNAPRTDRPLFSTVADAWLESKTRSLAETTLTEYRNTIEAYFKKPYGNKPMADIQFLDVDRLLSGLKVSNKTFNNILSVLRGIYVYGIKIKACTENHAAQIEFAKKEETEPDPLNQDEIAMVLKDMAEFYDEQVQIYFNMAFRIGFRPSEGIHLQWRNVDWNEKTLKITGAKVRRIEKDTKTHKSRIVEMDDDCMALLARLKKYTYMKGDHIFVYPPTGRPYPDTSNLVEKFWRPSLKRCKIRDRDARQTRHTCATMMLMAGCKPAWAADQLGHSIEMFLRTYSKWIPGGDKGRERAKMTSMFAESCQSVANGTSK